VSVARSDRVPPTFPSPPPKFCCDLYLQLGMLAARTSPLLLAEQYDTRIPPPPLPPSPPGPFLPTIPSLSVELTNEFHSISHLPRRVQTWPSSSLLREESLFSVSSFFFVLRFDPLQCRSVLFRYLKSDSYFLSPAQAVIATILLFSKKYRNGIALEQHEPYRRELLPCLPRIRFSLDFLGGGVGATSPF